MVFFHKLCKKRKKNYRLQFLFIYIQFSQPKNRSTYNKKARLFCAWRRIFPHSHLKAYNVSDQRMWIEEVLALALLPVLLWIQIISKMENENSGFRKRNWKCLSKFQLRMIFQFAPNTIWKSLTEGRSYDANINSLGLIFSVTVTAALPKLTRKALRRPVCFSGYKFVRIFCFCNTLLKLYTRYILTILLKVDLDYLLILVFFQYLFGWALLKITQNGISLYIPIHSDIWTNCTKTKIYV